MTEKASQVGATNIKGIISLYVLHKSYKKLLSYLANLQLQW